jgi:hypothetical protein
LLSILMNLLVIVFLIRGFITFTPLAAKFINVEPLMRLNKKYYSTLCLTIGLSFAIIRFI